MSKATNYRRPSSGKFAWERAEFVYYRGPTDRLLALCCYTDRLLALSCYTDRLLNGDNICLICQATSMQPHYCEGACFCHLIVVWWGWYGQWIRWKSMLFTYYFLLTVPVIYIYNPMTIIKYILSYNRRANDTLLNCRLLQTHLVCNLNSHKATRSITNETNKRIPLNPRAYLCKINH